MVGMVGVSFMVIVGGVGTDPLMLMEGGPTVIVGMLGFPFGRVVISSGILIIGIGGLDLAVIEFVGCSSGKLITGMLGLMYDADGLEDTSSGRLIIGIGGFGIVFGKSLGNGLASTSDRIDGIDLSSTASKTGSVGFLAGREFRPLS
jgi:hypothetical protein